MFILTIRFCLGSLSLKYQALFFQRQKPMNRLYFSLSPYLGPNRFQMTLTFWHSITKSGFFIHADEGWTLNVLCSIQRTFIILVLTIITFSVDHIASEFLFLACCFGLPLSSFNVHNSYIIQQILLFAFLILFAAAGWIEQFGSILTSASVSQSCIAFIPQLPASSTKTFLLSPVFPLTSANLKKSLLILFQIPIYNSSLPWSYKTQIL